MILMKDVPDETFAAEVLGKGAAIIPAEGKVYAPFDGQVSLVFDTKHAIALTSSTGAEVLIHIGINTVELGGKCYTCFVSDQENVKAGQLIAQFDMEGIKNAGYNLTTPVIVSNTDDYKEVIVEKTGAANVGEVMLRLVK